MLKSSLSPAALVFALSFLVYYNSLWGDFVFDDHRAILSNDDLDAEKTNVWGVFVNDFWGGHMSRSESHKSYRPLTVLTYRYLNFWLSGSQPFSYHLTNVLLHCASSVLFLLVCFKLLGTRKKWPSVFAATLFSVHSIHTEAVRDIIYYLFSYINFSRTHTCSLALHVYTHILACTVSCQNTADCKRRGESRSSRVHVFSPQSSVLHVSRVEWEWKKADFFTTDQMASRAALGSDEHTLTAK